MSDGKVAEGVQKNGGVADGKHSESVCALNMETASKIKLLEQKSLEENAVANEVAEGALKLMNGSSA